MIRLLLYLINTRVAIQLFHIIIGAVHSVSENIDAVCFRWGGCIVALTTKDTVNDYIKTVKEKFYKENPAASGKDLDSLVFATEPNVGAEIYEMKV